MAAPDSSVLAGLRNGSIARHLLLSLEHSQGTVYAWDGVRDIQYGGNTYKGVGGFARLEGVSESEDVQNNQVVATLNGVSLPALMQTDPNIRDRVAIITAIWVQETGNLLAARTLFVGKGDVLKLAALTENEKSLSAVLKSAIAEWRAAPRAYWTDADQQRRYGGDTGFKFVKNLENATTSGWSTNPPTTGDIPLYVDLVYLRTQLASVLIGDHTWGLTPSPAPIGLPVRLAVNGNPAFLYVEEISGASNSVATDGVVQVGGLDCYIDASGIVRTQAGRKVQQSSYLRNQGTIASDGSPTGTVVVVATGTGVLSGVLASHIGLSGVGDILSQNDWSKLVYCNLNGRRTLVKAGETAIKDFPSNTVYVEATTGTATAWSGGTSGTLQVGGGNCVASTTGVILSPGGRRIVKSGGAASEFLRVWT